MNKKLIISLVACSVLFVQRLKSNIEKLAVTIKSVRLQRVNFASELSADILFNILFVNPTILGVYLQSIQGDIYVNGVSVGYINNTYNYHVKGNATHLLEVVAHIDAAHSAEAIITNIESGNVNNGNLQFVGSVVVGSLFPITVKINKVLSYGDLVK